MSEEKSWDIILSGPLLDQIRELESLALWVVNTTHQNYHPEGSGGWRECDKPLCREVRKVLFKEAEDA